MEVRLLIPAGLATVSIIVPHCTVPYCIVCCLLWCGVVVGVLGCIEVRAADRSAVIGLRVCAACDYMPLAAAGA